jgi:hypothetical protein
MTETLVCDLQRRALVSVLGGIGLSVICASGGQATLPQLTPIEMNCADLKATQDSGLTEAQARGILKLLQPQFSQKTKRAGRAAKWDVYTGAFCSVTRDGKKFIVIDGIYNFIGVQICDDIAGFGIAYDPRKREFGNLTFGVSSCAPEKRARP